jgi:hypothetical protein
MAFGADPDYGQSASLSFFASRITQDSLNQASD